MFLLTAMFAGVLVFFCSRRCLQVFLTACLHQPLLELLAEDELFLDMDPFKMALRVPAQVAMHLPSNNICSLVSRYQNY